MNLDRVSEKANTVIGILAHVDAGKTTLAESILFHTGVLRKAGRVDHRDTAMDTHALEKERGITIFSSQARFFVEDRPFTLLDTPGHVDFSPEAERTLPVLDYAVLVISGAAAIQAHTRTLWKLLAHYRVPVFVFVTKMDYAFSTQSELMDALHRELSGSFVNFNDSPDLRNENVALCDDSLAESYLETGEVSDKSVCDLIAARKMFPVFFGSGLTGEGLPEFLQALSRYSRPLAPSASFRAKIFKVTHDNSGNKILHLKVTGGILRVKDPFGAPENNEKVNQMRLYTGEKFLSVGTAFPGDLVAVLGPKTPKCGDELGENGLITPPLLEPVMRYTVKFEDHVNPMLVMPKLRLLEEEDPMLQIRWNGFLSEIQVGLMGQVHGEILKQLILERLGLRVEFIKGHVLYKETIAEAVEGVGHYEPLRHYSEVHLLIEPAPRGSGLRFDNCCNGDCLDKSCQHLIMTHLKEKEHLGVLTGSPLTDVKVTLLTGRAHVKHTEGGDFRQATYRALRQGLMCTKSRLLEPYYRFRLELPPGAMNRAINDIRQMSGTFDPPSFLDGVSILSGRAPVSEMNDYAKDVASYSGSAGRLSVENDGYDFCHNEAEVIDAAHYDPEADAENSPDSIFCEHGVGFLVHWNEVPKYMHIEYQKK